MMFHSNYNDHWQSNMTLNVITEPTEEPVTVAEVRSQIHGGSDTSDDEAIALNISAARMYFEHVTGRAVVSTGYRQNLRSIHHSFHSPRCAPIPWQLWQTAGVLPSGDVSLWRGPTTAITAVHYVDASDVTQIATDYHSDLTGPTGRLWFTVLHSLTFNLQPVCWIDFTAGNANAASVPKDIKLAIRQLAAHYTRNRESHTETRFNDLPDAFRAICAKYWTGVTPFMGAA